MPERKLTRKQRGFVKDYVETENGKQSIIKNYNITDPESGVADVMAVENLRIPKIIDAIQAIRNSIADNIPDELLEKVHLEGLNAHTNGLPDMNTRHRYLDTAYKLKGIYAPDKSIVVDIAVDVTNEKAMATALEYEEKLKQQLSI